MKILVLLGVLVAVGLVVLVVGCAGRRSRTERAHDPRSAGSPDQGRAAFAREATGERIEEERIGAG